MRIIGGKKKGAQIHAPGNIPTRPTTDRSKESLFNILHNLHDLEECKVLDLFAGTGGISLEFASREAMTITAVDRNSTCARFLRHEAARHDFTQIEVIQEDVMRYLRNCPDNYDIIFADPPYDIFEHYWEMVDLIFERPVLSQKGTLALEHYRTRQFDAHPRFFRTRAYGQNVLSFFDFAFSGERSAQAGKNQDRSENASEDH